MVYSTYLLEVPWLLKCDWVERHARLDQLQYRTQMAVASRMSPCMLMKGSFTGIQARSVIPLRDDPRRSATTKKKVIAVKMHKGKHGNTKHLCKFFGMNCCRH